MRLEKVQRFFTEKGWEFTYSEENNCGSIEFEHRGVRYNIWEYPAPERGAESNVRNAGRQEDFDGFYEDDIIEIIREWKDW